jgi:ABC-type multidrug transport system permease subunit
MHRYVHQLEAQRAVADSLTSMFNTKSKELITTLMVNSIRGFIIIALCYGFAQYSCQAPVAQSLLPSLLTLMYRLVSTVLEL